jgi:hypothetical protein
MWSISESARMEADRLLGEALGRKAAMLAALTGGEAPSAPDYSERAFPVPPAIYCRAWLRLAAGLLRPGDLLWSPHQGLGEAAGLEIMDPYISKAPVRGPSDAGGEGFAAA